MKIFIGSSSENNDTLDEIAQMIESIGHEPIPWTKPGLFLAGSYTANRLLEIAQDEVDAAIMLFSPDDKVWYRGSEKSQPRDNVLFEHGLFSGVLGLDKAIIVISGSKSKIPSDLNGLSFVNFNRRSSSKIELKAWIKSINKPKIKFQDKNINTDNIDFKYFMEYQEDMRKSVLDFISELYWNYDLEEGGLEEYVILVLTKFINQFIGINDARFTLRQYNPSTDSMESLISTRQDAIPGAIPMNFKNLITESAKRDKPLIYSENKEFHYTSKNKSIDKGIYHDYVTYCLLETENNEPMFSICLDVKNPIPINRMKAMVHSLIFEIICIPIIEKILLEIDKTE
ncbi:nucleotide-binding protein [Tenacibaculum tangerinum]|uniref:Nucleotide-binding protein n=1 Tax=Tenacibaculum tangerinum TaxID=3038772 RepID=A0ABY8L513_9FLAO|nr:nucleotide-binding protein [Tenacibaculum tangerinum]WGH76171.1 nucleotide-binding protein [Tenacibaculum tangerinum]